MTDVVAPTPLTFVERMSAASGVEIFVKRDDRTHAAYGGSKVRKLVGLLRHAGARGATDLVTFGAAGSTHVLATTVHGRAAGFEVHGVLIPQWDTEVARAVLVATLAAGAHLYPVGGELAVVARAARLWWSLRRAGRRPCVIAPGGTSRAGVAGCVAGGDELRGQIVDGLMPQPDAVVCALGSGGLTAGLAVAMARGTSECRVIGVQARHGWATRPFAVRRWSRKLAVDRREARRAAALIDVVDGAGAGYGAPSGDGERAAALLAEDGVVADGTYVAKAAAWLLTHGRAHGLRRAVLWCSYASPPAALLGAPVPAALEARLLRRCLPPG